MPWSVAMRIGPALTTGSVPHTSTRYPGSPDGSTTRPNTSTAVLRSNAMTSGNATTATVCTARRYRAGWQYLGVRCLSGHYPNGEAGTAASMRCGPGSAIAALNWVASSSAVVARLAGTPNPSAMATKSRLGIGQIEQGLRLRAGGGGADTLQLELQDRVCVVVEDDDGDVELFAGHRPQRRNRVQRASIGLQRNRPVGAARRWRRRSPPAGPGRSPRRSV